MTIFIIRVMCLFVAMTATTVHCQQFLRRPQTFDRNFDNTGTSSPQQQFLRQQQSNRLSSRILDNRRGQFTSEFDQPRQRGSSVFHPGIIRSQNEQMLRDDFRTQALRRRPLDERDRLYQSRQLFQRRRQDPQSPEEIYRSRPRSGVQNQRRLFDGRDSRIDGRERFARIYPGQRELFTNQENARDRRLISNRQSSLSQERNPRRQMEPAYSPQRFASGISRTLEENSQPATFVNERSGNFPASANDGFSSNIRNQNSNRNAWPSYRSQLQERTIAQRQIDGEYLQLQQLEKERNELLQQKRKNEEQLRRGRIMLHQQQEKDQLLQQQLRGHQQQKETALQGRDQLAQRQTGLQGSDQQAQRQTGLQGKDQQPQQQTVIQGSEQQPNATITHDPAQTKQERMQQLADLLGFRQQDLHNAVTELEASKASLDPLAKSRANVLATTEANTLATTGADISTTDTSTAKTAEKFQSSFNEASTPPPNTYTTDIKKSSIVLTDAYTDTTSSTGFVNDPAVISTPAPSSPEPANGGHIASDPSHPRAHEAAASDSPTTSRNHNETSSVPVETPPNTLLRDNLLAAATESMLAEINKLPGLNKSLAASNAVTNTNSWAPEKNVTTPIANSTEFLDMSVMHASPELGATSPFLFANNETSLLNSTAAMTDYNVTMTVFMNTTESTNTTTAPAEVTEAVPTPPPPPPGFPHMFEPLPGQELTEAQLEYNEMREALMP